MRSAWGTILPAEVDWLDRRMVIGAILLVSIIPLLYPPIPPLIDVPGHMGRYRVMLGTDSDMLDQWFAFDWKLIGYIGFDLMVAGLARMVGLEMAVKLLVIAIPLITVGGIVALSKAVHGRFQAASLFAVPLTYHMVFHYGFLNYLFAMGLMLNALALWIRLGKAGKTTLRAILFVPIACVVWLFHVAGWMVLGVSVLMVEWASRLKRGDGLVRASLMAGISCIPLSLPMLAFLGWAPGGSNPTSDYMKALPVKPLWILYVLRDRWQWLDMAALAIVYLVLYAGVRSPRLRYAMPLVAAAAGLTALFIAMPFMEAYADARLAPYIYIFLLCAIGTAPGPAQRQPTAMVVGGLSFIIVRLAVVTASLAVESQEWQTRLAAVDHIPRGSRVAYFTTMSCTRSWKINGTAHLVGMAIVRRASFANDQYDLGPSALLTVRGDQFGSFAVDPSQFIVDRRCSPNSSDVTLAEALRTLPRDAFTHVWLVNPVLRPGMTKGLKTVWSDGRDYLFAIGEQEGDERGARRQ